MKKVLSFMLIFVMALSVLSACRQATDSQPFTPDNPGGFQPGTSDSSTIDGDTADKTDSEKTDIPDDLPSDTDTLTVTLVEGTDNCWTFADNVLTFSGLTANTTCSIVGEFNGAIVIDGGDDYKFELELCGVTLYSDAQSPIVILSGDKVTLTAKKGTKNYVYDTREAVDESDETAYSSAVYSNSDLDIGGKGELIVISANNNGIHTKDDLKVKNLTLSVTCKDNALKGNDSVTISGGVLDLIAKSGDGIKTTNTDVSSKGNQRGTVTVTAGTVNIYAACDGIDAAYNAVISDDAILNIYTDKYSPYSETVEQSGSTKYIRFTSNAYNYSIKYYNDANDYKWENATFSETVNGGRRTYYYYKVNSADGYNSFKLFAYSSSQTQGQENDYVFATDYMSWNTAYDTLAIESRGGSLSYNWANYSTSQGNFGGGMGGGFGGAGGGFGGAGGMGGMNDGNTDKGEYSTKGIKADNEVLISGGTITVNSYDDAIHANGGTTLENGETSTGNVVITGGTLALFSKDDAAHADGTLAVSGGTIAISGCYEGLEGNTVVINDGDISIVSSDDGINATATSGTGITFKGGTVYVYAGGDGVDSNSRTQYQGILFDGATVTIISTSGGDSSIDTENGYTYTSGTVLALCPANGMGNEAANCSNFSSVATKTTINLTKGQTLNVKVSGNTVASVTMPCNLSALAIYLGSTAASFSAE